jgi:glycosyltransferase involved in cell wall biosynthesis
VVDRNIACSQADRDLVRRAIDYQGQCVYYLNINKAWDKRKNMAGLVRAFRSYAGAMPQARLVVKLQQSNPGVWRSDEKVIVLSGPFTDPQINALYELANVYVSPHHGEGWGLTLSDAILFGKPTLATGYSGNLEFMTRENSILLDFSEEYIREEDCFGYFHSGMRWAYPNEDDLGKKMVELYENHESTAIAKMVSKAREDVKIFTSGRVQQLIHGRLDQILSS